jgi:hypothetical protein
MILKNLKGQVFGRLTVLRWVRNEKGKNIWHCRCSCSNYTEVPTSYLTSGNTRSCGCLRVDTFKKMTTGQTWSRKPKGTGGFNRLFSTYKNDARYRDIAFNLTKYEFTELTKQKCYYCNISPNQIVAASTKDYTKKGIAHSSYTYNDIDRVDNKLGYSKKNCVPCCSICNMMKGTLRYNLFLTKIKQISKNRSL